MMLKLRINCLFQSMTQYSKEIQLINRQQFGITDSDGISL